MAGGAVTWVLNVDSKRLKLRALAAGSGVTLTYYAIGFGILVGLEHRLRPGAGQWIALALFAPLIPGMLPGFLLSVTLLFLGVQGFEGTHDRLFPMFPMLTPPLLHSYAVYRWMRRKGAAKFEGPSKPHSANPAGNLPGRE